MNSTMSSPSHPTSSTAARDRALHPPALGLLALRATTPPPDDASVRVHAQRVARGGRSLELVSEWPRWREAARGDTGVGGEGRNYVFLEKL